MVDDSTNTAPGPLEAENNHHQEDEQSERPTKRARTRSRSPSLRKRSPSGSPMRSRSPLPAKEQTNGDKLTNGDQPKDEKDSSEEEEKDDDDDEEEEGEITDSRSDGKEETKTGSSTEEGEEPPSSPEEGEFIPPLPEGPPPDDDHHQQQHSDGWEAIWEESVGAYYFYNSMTGVTTWTNPRVPEENGNGAPPLPHDAPGEAVAPVPQKPARERYNPAIHGDYDPTAAYAQRSPTPEPQQPGAYATQGAFNRFTGRFQGPGAPGADRLTDENKTKKQMEYYFDVDAAANSHDGRSLKAERQNKKLSKAEVKAFRDRRRERKEEKRRAWLKD